MESWKRSHPTQKHLFDDLTPDVDQSLLENDLHSPLAFGAVGDAYGFCFEFASREFVEAHNDLHFVQHPEFRVVPGVYSDDTQMQLALAELMISGQEWKPATIAEHFVRVFQRDPRQGYAKRFYALLSEIRSGEELLSRIKPDSERNGAAMRAPIIGMIHDIETVAHYAHIQAAVTHDTPGGIDSAIASALMSHFFIHDLGTPEDLPEFLSQHLPDHDWSEPWTDKVPVHGIKTVRAALSAILNSNSLSQLLQKSIAFTGDVDSVATIACACASSSRYFRRDIPDWLWAGVERSDYGLPFLIEVDRQLREQLNEGYRSSADC